MWCGLLLVGFLAIGAQGFHPGPIRWGGRLGKKIFLTPTVPLDGIAAPQRLTLKESSDSKVPYFTANQDHTISCDDNDLRWCLEASGAERGHVVRVNHCTSRPDQKWRWLPWGPIQLEGTNQCIFVDENDGLTTATVQLGECVNKATDTWMFEDTAPALAWNSSHKFPFAIFLIGAAVIVSTLGLRAWMWRWRKESGMVLASKGSVPFTMDQGGACLTESIAVRSNEIAMKFQSGDYEGSWEVPGDDAGQRQAKRRPYKRVGDAPGVDEERVVELIWERKRARNRKDYQTADQILETLLYDHGVVVVDRKYTWRFVGDGHDGEFGEGSAYAQRKFLKPATSADGHDYTRRPNDLLPIRESDLQVIDELLATRLSKKRNREFDAADVIQNELYVKFGVYVDDRDRTWWRDS